MKTKTINTYSFDELNEQAKEKAREWFRAGNLDYDWYEFVFEDAKRVGALIGIGIDGIRFSGFWSQGDGASFAGSYEYKPGSVAAIRREAPQDTELHAITAALAKVQRRYFYQLGATVQFSHRFGNYCHEGCTRITVYDGRDIDTDLSDAEEEISELLRDFMRWVYKRLESEYEWLMSDEQVDESIRANEYEFEENGEIA